MNDSVFKFSLDIHQTRVQTFFNVMRGDTKRRLEVILTEKGEPYEITDDCYAVFSAKKADGHVIFNDCTIKDSTIFYTLTPQTVAAVGPLKCEIKLYGAGDALITSPRFTIAVEATLNEDDNIQIESADEVTALTALISQATAVVNEVETKLENGEFVGAPGKDGANATPEQIAEAVENYFEENPVPGGGSAEVTAESIEEALGYTPADEADIPTKTSQLENDSGFITLNDIPESGGSAEVTAESIKTALGYVPANPAAIPTKNSQLENDEEFVDEERLKEYAQPKDDYALKSELPKVPTKVSAFENDAGYAKQSDIPSVPTKTSDLTNDSGYITAKDIPAQPEVPVKSVFGRTGNVTAQKGDYTAEMVGARPNTWLPTPEEIGAKPASYSPNYEDVGAEKSGAVAEHNVDGGAHNDIRIVLNAVKASLEAFLDIDEPTFDQLSELIAKIQANAGTIEQLTNGKVNVADIVNNLTTNSSNKPLSAAQGVVLKGLIDSLDTLATGAKNAANEAKTAAQNAGTTATEAKNLANTANTNANSAKTTAQNASDKVDNLEERMDSGEFKGEDGAQGRRGTSLLLVTTTPSAYTTAVNGLTPAYRIALSTVKSQAKVDEVFVGDTVQRSYYLYPVIYVDASYAYCGARVSVRGAAGAAATIEVGSVTSGATASVENSGTTAAAVFDFVLPKGDKGDKGDPYTLTEADKAEIVQLVIESIGGNPIYGYIDDETKTVILKNAPDGTYTIGYINDDDTFVPIGSMEKDTNVYYTVTNNLTNCTTNNSATKVAQGESYSATITANSGYQLKSVSATMGGSAVTVTSGKINIASVTGNIVITAVAEEIVVAEPVTENITLLKDTSLKGTNFDESRTGTTGYCATPSIDLANIPKPCTIHLTGARWTYTNTSESGYIRYSILNTSGTKLAGGYTHSSLMPSGVTLETNNGDESDVTVTVTGNNIGKVRFAGHNTWNGLDLEKYPDYGTIFYAKATLTYTPN